jgi:hypothetical protein
MFESVGPESIDVVVVVVDDDIPIYTHSVSLSKVPALILSSLPPLPATRLEFRNIVLVSSLHLHTPSETALISVCLAIELLPFTFE